MIGRGLEFEESWLSVLYTSKKKFCLTLPTYEETSSPPQTI